MNTKKKSKHTHRYSYYGRTGTDKAMIAIFKCKCGDEVQRPMTKAEMRWQQPFSPKDGGVHRVWYEFIKKFMKRTNQQWVRMKGFKRKCLIYKEVFRWEGYKMMVKAGEWARRHPNDVQVVVCDDDCHASSILLLIDHKTHDKYMGTSVVYIPQCTGEKPIKFFLYPNHRSCLITALKVIQAGSVAPLRYEREFSKLANKNRPKWKTSKKGSKA